MYNMVYLLVDAIASTAGLLSVNAEMPLLPISSTLTESLNGKYLRTRVVNLTPNQEGMFETQKLKNLADR